MTRARGEAKTRRDEGWTRRVPIFYFWSSRAGEANKGNLSVSPGKGRQRNEASTLFDTKKTTRNNNFNVFWTYFWNYLKNSSARFRLATCWVSPLRRISPRPSRYACLRKKSDWNLLPVKFDLPNFSSNNAIPLPLWMLRYHLPAFATRGGSSVNLSSIRQRVEQRPRPPPGRKPFGRGRTVLFELVFLCGLACDWINIRARIPQRIRLWSSIDCWDQGRQRRRRLGTWWRWMRRRRQGIHFCVLGTRGSAGSRVRERTDEVEQRALGLAGEQNLGGNNIYRALALELRLICLSFWPDRRTMHWRWIVVVKFTIFFLYNNKSVGCERQAKASESRPIAEPSTIFFYFPPGRLDGGNASGEGAFSSKHPSATLEICINRTAPSNKARLLMSSRYPLQNKWSSIPRTMGQHWRGSATHRRKEQEEPRQSVAWMSRRSKRFTAPVPVPVTMTLPAPGLALLRLSIILNPSSLLFDHKQNSRPWPRPCYDFSSQISILLPPLHLLRVTGIVIETVEPAVAAAHASAVLATSGYTPPALNPHPTRLGPPTDKSSTSPHDWETGYRKAKKHWLAWPRRERIRIGLEKCAPERNWLVHAQGEDCERSRRHRKYVFLLVSFFCYRNNQSFFGLMLPIPGMLLTVCRFRFPFIPRNVKLLYRYLL